jgi:hypothetical protein
LPPLDPHPPDIHTIMVVAMTAIATRGLSM